MLLSMEGISKGFGAQEVFSDVTAKIEEGDRIGLIGVNGAGKTTLLNILCGNLECDSGQLHRKTGLRVGYLKQNSGLEQGNSIMQEMRSVFTEELAMEARILELTRALETAPPQEREALTAEYARLQSLFEAREGYQIDVKINTILSGMGFWGDALQKPIATLSGGEKTRLAICKLLLEAPELLILDEPTNHLDFRTLLWLEDYLASYKGALLLVSHDRYFLDRLISQVWEIEHRRFYTYSGNYTKYVSLKEERLRRQQKLYDQQQEEIADLEDFVARNMARASTAAMARSRQNTLEKMERVERPLPPPAAMKLRFETDIEPVKDVLTVQNLTLTVGEGEHKLKLAEGLNLEVKRGEKVAIVGANGTGKTTLLRVLTGQLPPQGRVSWGRNTKFSYFDQENHSLSPHNTVLEEVHRQFPTAYEQLIRSVLGSLGLIGEAVFKQVGKLSGGESARLKFAIMTMRRGNVLILDEPTNHLDLSAKEVLDQALADFEGTVVMVSHDRYLLDKVPNRIIEMTPQGLNSYIGGFTSYMEKANLRPQTTRASAVGADEKPTAKVNQNPKERRRQEAARKKALAETEAEIAATEQTIARLEQELALPETTSDYVRLDEICAGLEDNRQRLAQLMEDWVALSEESDK